MNIGIGIGIGLDYDSTLAGSGKTRYVFDDFNRVDNPSSLGNTVTGQTWDPVVDVWGILNNHARLSSSSATSIAVIESLQSTGISVQCIFSINSNEQRILFRYTDASNYWYVRRLSVNYELYKLVAGVDNLVDTFGTSPIGGDVIRVELVGSIINVKINGVIDLTANDGFNQSATIHGIGCVANTTPQWDDFIVEEL